MSLKSIIFRDGRLLVMLWAATLMSGNAVAGESLRTIRVGGLERSYLLHQPPEASSSAPLPLVIMLHGGGGNAANAAAESGWSKKADQTGFLVAYPNALPEDASQPASFRGNPQTWNDGSDRFKKSDGGPDDAAFIASMIDAIAADTPLDKQRIYLTGFSNGASMSFIAGAALSDRIAAIAPVAGACWTQEVTLQRAVPMHYITGGDDPLNPLDGGPLRFGLGGKDKPAVQDSILKWAKACGLPTTPFATRNEKGLLTHRYAAAGTSVEVLYTIIEGHGHIWPGGQTKLPEALVGKAMDSCRAVDVLWSFFASHRLDQGGEESGRTDPKVSENLSSAPAAALAPGNHTRVVQVDAMRRRYMVHVPLRYDASQATPVVIAYHGGGGNPESMIRLSGLDAKSDEAGFLVVYPYGSGPLENQFLTFHGGGCCGYAMENNIDDVAFTRVLLDDLAKVAHVDADRVYATGLSNGGIMSHYVASELSDRIAAIAPVGGPLMMDEPNAKRPVPVMQFHGTADAFAPFAGGYGKGSFGRSKGVTDFRSVEHTIRAWVKTNGCKAEPIVEPLPDKAADGMKVIRKTWTGGREGSEVVLIEIEGGGHTWPGKEPLVKMLGPSTLDISANDLMWEFFQKHPRTKKISGIPRHAIRSGWVTRAAEAPRVERRTFESRAAKTTVSFHVFKPEMYDSEKDRRFPVLYWLHGTGGGGSGIAPLSAFFDRAMRDGKLPPMLVVFPNGLAKSMWCDSKDGSMPVETVVVKELVPHIDSNFRTCAHSHGRIIEGFSMGGYGAARLGFQYPEVFGAVSILAGGPLDLDFRGPRAVGNPHEREEILRNVYGGEIDDFKVRSPITIVRQNAAAIRGKSLVRQAVGSRDFTAELNRSYSGLLDQLNITHDFTVVENVGHDTLALLQGLGDQNWKFYRDALESAKKKP